MLRQAVMIERGSMQAFPEEFNRAEIHGRYLGIFKVLESSEGISGGR